MIYDLTWNQKKKEMQGIKELIQKYKINHLQRAAQGKAFFSKI